eukprot:GHVN01082723.1.p1 GENE.GHVN01082723.1~~GHVN01082723.1.p1  ORF type:complete len:820 (+),score=148.00 GHVN01082723.1:730-3189(+)
MGLADLFLFSRVAVSPVYRYSALKRQFFTEKRERLTKWMTRIESSPSVKSSIQSHPGLRWACSESSGSSPTSAGSDNVYITTAINYTNGAPHMGHAYEGIMADAIARYHRCHGRDVFFLTGSDEHGQKVAAAAEKEGVAPIDICNKYAKGFQSLNEKLKVTADKYIRTSDPVHYSVSQQMWMKAEEAGDIYLSNYVGWYSVREEAFITELEAKRTDYIDPVNGRPYTKMEEATYMFRQSKYQQRLVKHIEENPEFIQPTIRRNEILARLQVPLEDLSSSRTTFDWGVPVPNDPKHVMYVWFDALTNYLTGVDALNSNSPLAHKWPASLHLIGKDITWFHCVIWPCMLMSAGVELPKTVFAHGFVSAADGRKMSKSLGNVVDPVALLDSFSSDCIRYYLMRGAPAGGDMKFDVDGLIDTHNSELADTVGNLVHRATALCVKFSEGRIPAIHHSDPSLPSSLSRPPFDPTRLLSEVENAMQQYSLQQAIQSVIVAARATNGYLTQTSPWTLSHSPRHQQHVIRVLIESAFYIACLMNPFTPDAASEVFKKLGSKPIALRSLSVWFDNLNEGVEVHVGEVLFAKIPPRVADIQFQRAEVRVALISSCTDHPKDTSLDIINLTSSQDDDSHESTSSVDKRVCVTKLSSVYPRAGLIGRRVLAVFNYKPSPLHGVLQTGLILAADLGSGKGHPTPSLLTLAVDGDSEVSDVIDRVPLGTLVEAGGYPPIIKTTDNITKAEITKMKFSTTGASSQVMYDIAPLRLSSVFIGKDNSISFTAESGDTTPTRKSPEEEKKKRDETGNRQVVVVAKGCKPGAAVKLLVV